jgi:hypothetical protein
MSNYPEYRVKADGEVVMSIDVFCSLEINTILDLVKEQRDTRQKRTGRRN